MADNVPIMELLQTYVDGIAKKDWQMLADLYTADIKVYDAWDDWELSGQEWLVQLHRYIDSMGEDHDRVTMTHLVIHAGESVTYLSALFTYARHDAAGKFLAAMENRITMGLILQDGQWKIGHEHSSIPVGFEDGKGIYRVTLP